MARTKQTATKSCGGRRHGPPVRRVLAVASVREPPPVPVGPTTADAPLRAPGLLLGFPITAAGDVAGVDDATAALAPAPVRLPLHEVNSRFQRTSSLLGACAARGARPTRQADSQRVLQGRSCASRAPPAARPQDGSAGGLAAATVAHLRAVVDALRKRQPKAQLAILMHESDDLDTPAVVRADARVPCAAVGNVLVEFGVARFQAEALQLLVRAYLTRVRVAARR